jgi:putative hydrolase of the HAD superfamily
MILHLKPNSFFVFDLDDTLYPEIDFLKSGYRIISEKILAVTGNDIYEEMIRRYKLKENVFEWISSAYSHKDHNLTTSNLLKFYREHVPLIKLSIDTKQFLQALKEKNIPVGLITDGRYVTQMNKIKSLGLSAYFKDIIISEEFGSEKPDERNYLYFQNKYPTKSFYFIGDNTIKDFFIPLKLGWVTICLKDNGQNIHSQNFEDGISPDLIINSFSELNLV